MLLFEYFEIMVGNIYQMYYMNLIGDDFCCYIQIYQLLDCQNLFWLKNNSVLFEYYL